jgi:hypothetical protein
MTNVLDREVSGNSIHFMSLADGSTFLQFCLVLALFYLLFLLIALLLLFNSVIYSINKKLLILLYKTRL